MLLLFALNTFGHLNYIVDGLRNECYSDFLQVVCERSFSLFSSRQHFISESMVAETWCLILAVTCSWNKKRIICKPCQVSFRGRGCPWGKVHDPHRGGTAYPRHRRCELGWCSRSWAEFDLRHCSSLPGPPGTDSATWKTINLELGMEPAAVGQAGIITTASKKTKADH